MVGEGAAAEAGDAEGGGEAAEDGRRQRRRLLPPSTEADVELEVVEAGEGGGAEPGLERAGGGGAVEVEEGLEWDAEAAAWAGVGGEDAGDLAEAEPVAVAGEVEVERGRAPEGEPTGGEDLCAGAVFGWEEGDDVAQDAVRELADEILSFFFHLCALACGDLVLRPHGGWTAARSSWGIGRGEKSRPALRRRHDAGKLKRKEGTGGQPPTNASQPV